jgi:hypothetical protein
MKERLVRGTNVRDLVRALRAHQRLRPLPDLGPWEQDLLRKHVSTTTWYSLTIFERLLAVLHRYVYDGSEASAQSIGRAFAKTMIAQDANAFIHQTPLDALGQLHAHWRMQFNFGDIVVSALPDEAGHTQVRVKLTGFPDMSATHGHTLVGWTTQLVTEAGARDVQARIEERPWMHNSALTFTLLWD